MIPRIGGYTQFANSISPKVDSGFTFSYYQRQGISASVVTVNEIDSIPE